MNREGHENTNFFVGKEVERTPAYGMQTLFVVDLQPVDQVELMLTALNCKHIFFGANHSFDPVANNDWDAWEAMIRYFLVQDYLCTLDIPVSAAEDFLESSLVEWNNFIPQIRIPLPYIKQWNYNTMIKLDDKDFNATNPGVWCHNLHDLMDRSKYTDWRDYKGDTKI
jgi:hypothetical protein